MTQKTLPTKKFSRQDLENIDWVQNISGTDMHIPLNEEGKRGFIIKKDDVIQLSTFFTKSEKLKCRGLYDAFIGLRIGHEVKIMLRALKGPDDPRIIQTSYKINKKRFARTESNQPLADVNIHDVQVMRVKLKELQENIDSLPEDEREIRQTQIDAYKKKIREVKARAIKDMALTTKKTGGVIPSQEPEDEDADLDVEDQPSEGQQVEEQEEEEVEPVTTKKKAPIVDDDEDDELSQDDEKSRKSVSAGKETEGDGDSED